METRNIKLTLEKAREFYNKGGEFRDLILSAFSEEELLDKKLHLKVSILNNQVVEVNMVTVF